MKKKKKIARAGIRVGRNGIWRIEINVTGVILAYSTPVTLIGGEENAGRR